MEVSITRRAIGWKRNVEWRNGCLLDGVEYFHDAFRTPLQFPGQRRIPDYRISRVSLWNGYKTNRNFDNIFSHRNQVQHTKSMLFLLPASEGRRATDEIGKLKERQCRIRREEARVRKIKRSNRLKKERWMTKWLPFGRCTIFSGRISDTSTIPGTTQNTSRKSNTILVIHMIHMIHKIHMSRDI